MRSLNKFLLAILLPLHAFAADPLQQVQDIIVEQNTEQMLNTLNNSVVPQISRQTDSLRTMNNTLQQGLTGSNAIGESNNLPAEQNFRNWTPSSADLISMVEQGLQTGSLADQITYYNQKFHIPTAEQLAPGNAQTPMADYGVFAAVNTNAALSVADKSFNNVAQLMEQINFLYRQIDQQRTLKQSQELNSVILLKIAALQTDLIRIQSQQLKMLAVSNAQGNSQREYMTQFVQDIK